MAEPTSGALLGERFRLEVTLEARGMNDLHRGVDLDTGDDVAIRTLSESWSHHEPSVARVVERLRRASEVHHPNLMPMLGAGPWEGGGCWAAMPWVEGTDLGRLMIGGRRMAARDVAMLLWPVAGALAALHDAGIVHRTFAPNRVVMGSDGGSILLGGYGYGPLVAPEDAEDERSTTRLSGPSQLDYLAPDAALGAASDHRIDVYALAAVVYRAIAGAAPYERESSLVRAIVQRQAGPPPTLSERLREPVRPALEAVMRRGLAADPSERYASATEFASAFWLAARDPNEDDEPPQLSRAELVPILTRIATDSEPFERVTEPRGHDRAAILRAVAIGGGPEPSEPPASTREGRSSVTTEPPAEGPVRAVSKTTTRPPPATAFQPPSRGYPRPFRPSSSSSMDRVRGSSRGSDPSLEMRTIDRAELLRISSVPPPRK